MTTEAAVQENVGVRDRLLNAAERVVVRDGVQNLTLEAVAREAGVSKGGLLYHFPSKRELIVAIVERLASQCDEHQKQTVSVDEKSAGAFVRAYIGARTADPPAPEDKPVHIALLAAAATDREYLAPIRKRSAEWQALLENDGIDPATANVIRLAVDGLCLGSMFGLPVPTGEMRRRVIEKLMQMTRPCSSAHVAKRPEGSR